MILLPGHYAWRQIGGHMDWSLLLGILGGLFCLFGFSLYWGGLRVLGMFLGGTVGALVGVVIAYVAFPYDRAIDIAIIVGLAFLGIGLGWRLLRALHGVLVFLIGVGLGYLLAWKVLADLGGIWAARWMPFAMAVAGGILATLLFRYVIIVVTCALGSFLIYQAAGGTTQVFWVLPVSFFIGMLIQLGVFHRLNLGSRIEKVWD